MKRVTAIMLIVAAAALSWGGQAAAKAKQGVSGRYNCACMSGDTVVVGTCSTKSTGGNAVSCGKNAGDTCTATCKMVTFQKGLSGGSIANSPGAKIPAVEAPMLQKAR